MPVMKLIEKRANLIDPWPSETDTTTLALGNETMTWAAAGRWGSSLVGSISDDGLTKSMRLDFATHGARDNWMQEVRGDADYLHSVAAMRDFNANNSDASIWFGNAEDDEDSDPGFLNDGL